MQSCAVIWWLMVYLTYSDTKHIKNEYRRGTLNIAKRGKEQGYQRNVGNKKNQYNSSDSFNNPRTSKNRKSKIRASDKEALRTSKW